MSGIPAAENMGRYPTYLDKSGEIDDPNPKFSIDRMELVRRVVRHARSLKVRASGTELNADDQMVPEEEPCYKIPTPRSRSLQLPAFFSPLRDATQSEEKTHAFPTQPEHVTLDAEVLLHHQDSFPETFVRNRIMSMDSFCSEETFCSLSSSDCSDYFNVLLFNKFGTMAGTTEGLTDARSVSHVYKGAVLVTDILDSKVVWFERSGKPLKTFMMKASTEPWAAMMTPDGHIAVTLRRQHCVALWTNDGKSMMQLGHGRLECPAGLGVDKSGRIFVADEQLNDVLAFNQSGQLLFKLTDSGQTFNHPRYVVCSNSGRIIVADSGNHCVKVFDNAGVFLFKFGSYGKGNGQFKVPYGVCVDQHDNIIVADHYNDRVLLFSKKGEFLQTLVTAASGLKSPCGVSVRCTHNRKLYITHGGLRASEVVVFNLVPMDNELSINVKYFV